MGMRNSNQNSNKDPFFIQITEYSHDICDANHDFAYYGLTFQPARSTTKEIVGEIDGQTLYAIKNQTNCILMALFAR